MTTTDWITDIALVLVVFRQLREDRLSLTSYLIPLGIVAFVASHYLHSVPTAGNDLVLIGTLVAAGAALGIAGGIFTRIRAAGEHLLIKAGAASALLWVLGMGARMVFQVWVDHGGADDVARFSVTHHITTGDAWVAAFVLMALTEVVTRLATIFIRSRMVVREQRIPTAPRPGAVLDRTA
ncbi:MULTISPECIES: hypothetical protein [Streptomyces]|jgi:hypothetical protein|uniref:Integral membrane protein n=1 Tax=Streptomyces spinosisporus TaxID=2927582 RepID=A0ABS9XHR2_9ACTN|nr:hypothetical protein [Streptomyces spinosisporus]MCI3241624.1 hypothetical protein [Streptomyces spinosisporus]